eukprot:2720629-Prymnesium_polylepis.1
MVLLRGCGGAGGAAWCCCVGVAVRGGAAWCCCVGVAAPFAYREEVEDPHGRVEGNHPSAVQLRTAPRRPAG